MSTQRSPYQTGSGLGINAVLAYINANPNSISAAVTNQTWPKTVQLYSISSPPVTHFSETGYTSIVDESNCVQNNKYTAKLKGTYAITMKCDTNINANVTIYVKIGENGAQPNNAFQFHENNFVGPYTTLLDLNNGETLDFFYDSTQNVTDIVIKIAFIHT